MSKSEQHANHASLKSQKKKIVNQMAGIEVGLKEAAISFADLSRSLEACQVGNLNWTHYQKLVSNLPYAGRRYEALKLELAGVQAQLDKSV
jgi:hypothetical protein